MQQLATRHSLDLERPPVINDLINPFALSDQDGYFWLKGNLHSHTSNSDGNLSPKDLVDLYRQGGYDFLAITDHNLVTRVSQKKSDSKPLLIPGAELHPSNDQGGQVHHFLCLGLQEDIDAQAMSAQAVLDQVASQGGQVWLAHPHWSSVTISRDVLHLHGFSGLEVFNATCLYSGRGLGTVSWDEWMGLEERLYPALAVDDCHHHSHKGQDHFQGWVMVRVQERSPQAILAALRQGAFYASNGPEIHNIQLEPVEKNLEGCPLFQAAIECSPAAMIVGVGEVYGSNYEQHGSLSTSARFRLDPGSRWVRFELHDGMGNTAWSNPLELTV